MTRVKAAKPQRDNFHMIPRVVETMALSSAAYRLYGLLKSELQETHGSVEASQRNLARRLKVDPMMIQRAKVELIGKGLLDITPGYRGTHVIRVKEIWHQNHALHHQTPLPTESPGSQSDPRLNHQGASRGPTESPEIHTESPEIHTESPEIHTESPEIQWQIQNGPIDTKILRYQDMGPEASDEALHNVSSEKQKDPSIPPEDQSYESFKERMAAAAGNRDKVAVLVDLVRAYTRERSDDPGGKAAALLKRVKGDGGYALSLLARSCVSQRAGDVFTYAQGIARNGTNRSPPRRVEAHRDPKDFRGGFWGDEQ